MSYTRFEDLPVSKDAARLFVGVCELTDRAEARRKGDWADQLERASLSISNNIAEGFELGTADQLLRFLYIAKGSAGECRSMLAVAMALPHMSDLRSQISDLRSKADSISRQLGGWCQQLQNSDIKGPRHLNDAVREATNRRAHQGSFLEEIKRVAAEGRRESPGLSSGEHKS